MKVTDFCNRLKSGDKAVIARIIAEETNSNWYQHPDIQRALSEMLDSRYPETRRRALLALSYVRVAGTLPRLIPIALQRTSPPTRCFAVSAIANQRGEYAEAILVGVSLSDAPRDVRETSIRKLGEVSPWKLEEIADNILEEGNWEIAWAIAQSLTEQSHRITLKAVDIVLADNRAPGDITKLADTLRRNTLRQMDATEET